MTATQRFIEAALQCGLECRDFTSKDYSPQVRIALLAENSLHEMLLNPEAWKAVGIAKGNKDTMYCDSRMCNDPLCEYAGYWNWRRAMVGLMEHLAEGVDIESYLATIV